MHADERREAAIRAAMTEFGRSGYTGTPSAAIAKRIGVSQPYLFRLFPTKKALFLAAVERCFQQIESRLNRSADGLEGEDAFRAMCTPPPAALAGYDERDVARMQLQMYAASVGDEAVRGLCRRARRDLWAHVSARTGVTGAEPAAFFDTAMLVSMWAVLDAVHCAGESTPPSAVE